MPLTFAHPIAVVPLHRLGLPLSALVVGSMIPDAVLFARLPVSYEQTHAFLGVVSVDLVLGILAWLLWERLLHRPLVDAAPAAIRHRLVALPPTAPNEEAPRRRLIPVAIVVGALTHVIWDAFTHPGRWGTELIPWLAQMHGPLVGAKWAQYASGVGGLLALAVIAGVALGRTQPLAAPRSRPRLAPWVLLGPALAALLTAGLVAADGSRTVHDLAFDGVTRGGSAAAVALLLASAAWHLVPPRQ